MMGETNANIVGILRVTRSVGLKQYWIIPSATMIPGMKTMAVNFVAIAAPIHIPITRIANVRLV
jgi:hypothetical protein